MSTTTAETHLPQLLSASLIATPVFYFAALFAFGAPSHLAIHLLAAWSIAAVASAFTFAVDRRFYDQFTTRERLAILAGNGMVGLFVAPMGFMAFGAG